MVSSEESSTDKASESESEDLPELEKSLESLNQKSVEVTEGENGLNGATAVGDQDTFDPEPEATVS